MAQAPVADNTDELLSQLAASEIDRLLSEPDGKPATPQPAPAETAKAEEALTEGTERAALLEAAGFDATHAAITDSADATAHAQPTGDERSALLKAAGFESVDAVAEAVDHELAKPIAPSRPDEDIERPLPIYLKPLVWINAPMETCPKMVRPLLGGIAVVTMINALVALAYFYFSHKH